MSVVICEECPILHRISCNDNEAYYCGLKYSIEINSIGQPFCRYCSLGMISYSTGYSDIDFSPREAEIISDGMRPSVRVVRLNE